MFFVMMVYKAYICELKHNVHLRPRVPHLCIFFYYFFFNGTTETLILSKAAAERENNCLSVSMQPGSWGTKKNL